MGAACHGRTARDRSPRAPQVIHLDTSFLIRALVRGSREDAALRAWLGKADGVAISALAWTEFLCGPVSSRGVELAVQLLGEPLPFAEAEATTAAMLFNESGRRRGSIIDCMIAAGAIEAGAMLATVNLRDFQRLTPLGLRLAEGIV